MTPQSTMVSLEQGNEGRGGGRSNSIGGRRGGSGRGRGGNNNNRGRGSSNSQRRSRRGQPPFITTGGDPSNPTSATPLTTTTTMTMTSWLGAIQASTSCLFRNSNGNGQHQQQQHRQNSSSCTVHDIDNSLTYLNVLQRILLSQPTYDVPPNQDPPPFQKRNDDDFVRGRFDSTTTISHQPNGGPDHYQGSIIQQQQHHNAYVVGGNNAITDLGRLSRPTQSSNQFSCIYQSSDEDDDNDDHDNDNDLNDNFVVDGYDDEAGDTISPVGLTDTTSSPSSLHQGNGSRMDTLRLLVRVSASQSDLYARSARLLADDGLWMDGAVALEAAVGCLRTALNLCDTEISKYLHQQQQIEMDQQVGANTAAHYTTNSSSSHSYNPSSMTLRYKQLQEDADIVHVSTQCVIREKDKYVRLAQRQVERLQRILEPQWETRDVAKARIGEDKWKNNPSPKHDYARLRVKHEAELKQLQQALEHLETTTGDTAALEESINQLRDKLRSGGGGRGSGGGRSQQHQQSKRRTRGQYQRRRKVVPDREPPT